MKQTINFSQFHDAFRNMDRLDNFSYQGLRVLYDWFEELDADCGTETELDVIAICCEFNEDTIDEFFDNYSDCNMEEFDDERDAIEFYIAGNSPVVGWVSIPDNGWRVIYQAF